LALEAGAGIRAGRVGRCCPAGRSVATPGALPSSPPRRTRLSLASSSPPAKRRAAYARPTPSPRVATSTYREAPRTAQRVPLRLLRHLQHEELTAIAPPERLKSPVNRTSGRSQGRLRYTACDATAGIGHSFAESNGPAGSSSDSPAGAV